jgi:hypothetical protein
MTASGTAQMRLDESGRRTAGATASAECMGGCGNGGAGTGGTGTPGAGSLEGTEEGCIMLTGTLPLRY